MDQARLVRDELDEGERFIRRLHESLPVSVAFWMKTPDDSPWYLYVASDALGDVDLRSAYRLVSEAGTESTDPNFDSFTVKLIRGDDPLAEAARQATRDFAPSRVMRFGGSRFGDRYAEAVYLYPSLAPAAVAGGSPPP